MRWYPNVAVGGLVAAVVVWLAAWLFSLYPWAPPRSFEFVRVTYHVTRTTVRAVGPRVNWAASGPPPRILCDLWAVPGHHTYRVLAFRTKWAYFLAKVATPPGT